ncbi:MAG: Rubredoxin [Euryarchaeota archaeon ADurb.Bin165]|jgi:rubredoxin|nr:MAG: Rubredoxin [Euryarchaeota archaeon ADurb.Bin165]
MQRGRYGLQKRLKTRIISDKVFNTKGELMSMAKWQCLECAYMYNPEKGDKSQNVPPGTPFEKLPKTWRCPECKVSIQKYGVFVRRD